MQDLIFKLLEQLKKHYKTDANADDLVEFWTLGLDGLTPEDLVMAQGFKKTLAQHQSPFLPTPAQFRKYAGLEMVGSASESLLAWNKFVRLIGSPEDWQGRHSLDPVFSQTIHELGGTFHFKRMKQSELGFQQRNFEAEYNNQKTRRKELEQERKEYNEKQLRLEQEAKMRIEYKQKLENAISEEERIEKQNASRDKALKALSDLSKRYTVSFKAKRDMRARKEGINIAQSDMRREMLKGNPELTANVLEKGIRI